MSKLITRAIYPYMAQPFVSTETTRYHLCGVNVRPHSRGGVLLAATDTAALGIWHDAEGRAEGSGNFGIEETWKFSKEAYKACKPNTRDCLDLQRWLVILPIEGVEKHAHKLWVVLADTAEAAENAAQTDNDPDLVLHREPISPIDGRFPDYPRVMPANPFAKKLTRSGFNGRLFDRFKHVAQVSWQDNKILRHSANMAIYTTTATEGPSLIMTGRNDFIGVIAPYRGTADEWYAYPHWWTNQTPEISSGQTEAAE